MVSHCRFKMQVGAGELWISIRELDEMMPIMSCSTCPIVTVDIGSAMFCYPL